MPNKRAYRCCVKEEDISDVIDEQMASVPSYKRRKGDTAPVRDEQSFPPRGGPMKYRHKKPERQAQTHMTDSSDEDDGPRTLDRNHPRQRDETRLRAPPHFSQLPGRSPEVSSASNLRSTPMKQRHNRNNRTANPPKLEKPVLWEPRSPALIRMNLQVVDYTDGRDHGAVSLFDSIHNRSVRGRGYLPTELELTLMCELSLTCDDYPCFARRSERPLCPIKDADLTDAKRRYAMLEESRSLRYIVRNTNDFKSTPRSEEEWNEHIHQTVLQLALQDTPSLLVEDVTRVDIVPEFLPPTEQALGSSDSVPKNINYVFALRPSPNDGLYEDLLDFIDALRPKNFGQNTHPSLRFSPTGVFIAAKADSSGYAEGQFQLVRWIASWLERVSEFDAISEERVPVPCLPVLLAAGGEWQLWFAIDKPTRIEVFGPVDIGNTTTLDGAYRLLAALRHLAEWMDGPFREWVTEVISPHAVGESPG